MVHLELVFKLLTDAQFSLKRMKCVFLLTDAQLLTGLLPHLLRNSVASWALQDSIEGLSMVMPQLQAL